MSKQRHSWGPPTRIPSALAMPRKTERQCTKCPVVKVTWHLPDLRFRKEFWRGLDRIEGQGTPACEIISGESVAA